MKCMACGHEETTGEEFLQIQVLGAAPMAGDSGISRNRQ